MLRRPPVKTVEISVYLRHKNHMNQRLNDRGVERKSDRLKGKRVALAACGGIGAVELVRVTRELRRHGAEVTIFITPSVTAFISELSLEWAAGSKVVREAGAGVDHLEPFDLVVVAPATLNTISKCALGITDNVVTLLIAGQLGRNAPLLFVPTMNVQLRNHPAFAEHVTRLQLWGAQFFPSEVEENRLKMPSPELILEQAVKSLAPLSA